MDIDTTKCKNQKTNKMYFKAPQSAPHDNDGFVEIYLHKVYIILWLVHTRYIYCQCFSWFLFVCWNNQSTQYTNNYLLEESLSQIVTLSSLELQTEVRGDTRGLFHDCKIFFWSSSRLTPRFSSRSIRHRTFTNLKFSYFISCEYKIQPVPLSIFPLPLFSIQFQIQSRLPELRCI